MSADKGYDAAELIEVSTDLKVLSHVAQNTRKRKLIAQGLGWAMFIGPIRQVVRGLKTVD